MLKPGDILNGRYQIIAKIGQGGFGQTYQAVYVEASNPLSCVVKEIVPPPSPNPRVLGEIEQRFAREAKSLAKLGEHPQIPQLYDYFQQQGKFYLIQEYIEGHDLSEEIAPGKPSWTEAKVIQLLEEVLPILQFIHQQDIIHRDLKPSNLRRCSQNGKIVLIDFGAVKELTSVVLEPEETSMNFTQAIGTPGYMPAEQQSGNPQLNSDLYALGMICIQALTGFHPRTLPSDPSTGSVIWHYSTADRNLVEVSPGLEQLLNKMVHYHFRDRFASAAEVLEALHRVPQRPSSKLKVLKPLPAKKRPSLPIKWFFWGFSCLTLALGMTQIPKLQKQACSVEVGDNISCGEEILSRNFLAPEKEEGVKAFSLGNYKEAVTWFELARKKLPSDPETLIYLNNAQLAAQRAPYYTIAVAVPLGNPSDGGDSGREILRGVAQIQSQINQTKAINGSGLQVVLADDANTSFRAQQVAEKLGARAAILGVVGHYTSGNTRAALPIYEKYNLVLISPTSTAQTLAQDSKVFFRTVPQDQVTAQALAQYLYQQAKTQKVAIFYNRNSNYSSSLRDQFLLSFDELGGLVVRQFDLSEPFFDADATIDEAAKRGATGLILFPDAKENPYTFTNSLKVIRTNQNRYQIAGGDSLYTSDILQEKKPQKIF